MTLPLTRRLRGQAAGGALLLVALVTLERLPPWTEDGAAKAALLFAVLVLVPLGLALIVVPDRRGKDPWVLRALAVLQGPAALLAAAGILLPQGALAGALCVPWVVVALLGALWAAQRFLQRPWPLAEEVVLDAGLVFLLNGAAFLAIWRSGVPAGFPDVVVALTAVHFHFASFAIPVMLGMAGRALRARRDPWFPWVAGALVVGMPVTAAGIIASPPLEALGSALVAASGLAAAVLAARAASKVGRGAGLLLTMAAMAAFGGMALAAAYGLRSLALGWTPSFEQMLVVHSLLNGLGFSLAGFLGWTRAGIPAASPPPGIAFSRQRSRGPVGPDFFERTDAVDPTRGAPRGLVADLGAFANPWFHPRAVHPAIRRFYEDTLAYELVARAEWKPGSALGRRVWRAAARRFGQMDFPESPEEGRLDSQLLALRDDMDGRTDVRGWVRTRADGRTLYAAAYSTHRWGQETYANIAFPLPGGSMTSVLRWVDLPGHPGGLVLTTHPGDRPGDQGVYFVNRFLPVRLPINETIAVWMEDGVPRAKHEVRVLGRPFLTLHYRMVAGR
jgi:hypothetical protein